MYYWLDGSAINDYKEQNKKQNLYYVNEKPELSFEHIETQLPFKDLRGELKETTINSEKQIDAGNENMDGFFV